MGSLVIKTQYCASKLVMIHKSWPNIVHIMSPQCQCTLHKLGDVAHLLYSQTENMTIFPTVGCYCIG